MCDRVPIEILKILKEERDLNCIYIRVVQNMYEVVSISVRIHNGKIDYFSTTINMHQSLTLNL